MRIVMEIWNNSPRVLNGFGHGLERDLAGCDGDLRGSRSKGRLAGGPTACDGGDLARFGIRPIMRAGRS
jgi:hypothetical protein